MSERIVKIAENNVEVRKIIVDKETDEEYVVETKSYGTNKLDEELQSINDQITNWSDSKWVDAFVIKTLADLNKQKTTLTNVKAELEKE